MENWHEWRKAGLGASDAPVVMNVSPYKTRFQLWEEKLGLSEHKMNEYMANKGHEMEIVARQKYESLYKKEMPVFFCEHPDFPFVRASLDGYDGETILEIKYVGKDDYGKIPDRYYPQLQHQLLASGSDVVHYCGFNGTDIHVIEIRRDEEYIRKLLEELKKFWDLVQKQTPPELTDRDFKKVKDPELGELVEKYRSMNAILKQTESTLEFLKKQIIEKLPKENIICNGMKISKTFRQGTIDYKAVPNIDWENYRKKGSFYYVFREIK